MFVCNTFLQYKLIKLFSICLYAIYATLFNFCIFTTSLNLFICKTIMYSVFIKLLSIWLHTTLFYHLYLSNISEFVSMHHFSIFCIVQLYLFICNTFLHSVSSSFICLNATLFLFQYLSKFCGFVCVQYFSPI